MRRRIFTLFLAMVAGAVLYAPSAAQTPGAIRLMGEPQPVVIEGNALQVRIPFVVLDGRQNVLKTDVALAQLAIGGAGVVTGTVGPLATESRVAFLLDTSDSYPQRNDLLALADAMGKTVEGVGDGARYQLFAFDNDVRVLVDLTGEVKELQTALAARTLAPRARMRACLNDALLQVINRIQNAPGKKAIVIGLAGRDDCGKATLDEALNAARSADVRLFVVGLQGAPSGTLAAVEDYGQRSGGYAAVAASASLREAFLNVVAAVRNLSVAVFELFPGQGRQDATLNLRLADRSLVTAQVAFFSPRAFTAPSSVRFRREVIPGVNLLRAQVDLGNKDAIGRLDAAILDAVTREQEDIIRNLAPADELSIPTTRLVRGREYILQLNVTDLRNQRLTVDSPPFKFEPRTAQIRADLSRTPTPDQPRFVVTPILEDWTGVQRVEAFAVGEKGPAQTFVGGVRQPISVTYEGLADGTYQLFVRVIYADSFSEEAKIGAPVIWAAPNALQQLVLQAQRQPVLYLGALALVLAAAVALIAVVRVVRAGPRQEAQEIVPGMPARPVMRQIPVFTDTMGGAGSRKPSSSEGTSGVPAATLKQIEPASGSFEASVRKSPFVLGRADGAHGRLGEDRSLGVSGKHASLVHSGGAWAIRDEASTNGTFVNGARLASGESRPLQNGDIIGLGPRVKLMFHTGG